MSSEAGLYAKVNMLIDSVDKLILEAKARDKAIDDLSDGLALEREEIEERVSRNTDALFALISRVEELGRHKEPLLVSRSEAEPADLVAQLGRALEGADAELIRRVVLDLERVIPVPRDGCGRRSIRAALEDAAAAIDVEASRPQQEECQESWTKECRGATCSECLFCPVHAYEANRQGEGSCPHCEEAKP